MKRQRNILNFLHKIPRTGSSVEEATEIAIDDIHPSFMNNFDATSASDMSTVNTVSSADQTNATATFDNSIATTLSPGDQTDAAASLPDCWNTMQYENFLKRYDGLIARSKKLGCDHCAECDSMNITGIRVSTKWVNCRVEGSGNTTTIMQASLRKKMKEHFSSKAHKLCVKQEEYHARDALTKSIDKMNKRYIASTCRVFNAGLAKRCRPFSDIEDEIELQIRNGIDMGAGLYSWKTAVKIVDHIAKNIKSEIFTKIIAENLKICVIVDKASTKSNIPVLIIFLKIEDCAVSPMIFFDLVELEGQGAEQRYASLLMSLHDGGFDNKYLRNNLIAFCFDGASVMLGYNSGVSTRLKNDYPNIIVWHYLNHHLQLILDDSVNDIKQVNHFKIFRDKIYTIFHQLSKNQMPLFKISEMLEQQILKIGRALGPRWAACSLRSALACSLRSALAYPALYKYFSGEAKHSGMAACLCNRYFLENLALMIDTL